MVILKKFRISMILISIVFIILEVVFCSLLTKLFKNSEIFVIILVFFLITSYTIITRKMFLFLYKKYINILNEELNPEKIIEVTQKEIDSTKKILYKNNMKINMSAGYSCLNNTEKALSVLEEINVNNKKGLNPALKILYYYDKALYLFNLERIEEAKETYEKLEETLKRNKKVQKRLEAEQKIFIDILKCIIYDDKYSEKLIEKYEKVLKISKTKRYIVTSKYSLAEINEKIGNVEEALKLYKEVSETGNKLFIAQKAKDKVTEFICMEEKNVKKL